MASSSSSVANDCGSSVPRPTPERASEIADNLASVKSRLEAASSSRPSPPRLVAVSKLKPSSDILAAFEAGHRHFGENYAQELEDKAAVLPREIRWHFIGGLQTNKCKNLALIPNLDAVETVDTAKKIRALQKARSTLPAPIPPLRVYIQVNTSGESAKSGVALPTSVSGGSKAEEEGQASQEGDSDSEDLVELVKLVISEEESPNLTFAGLMTIGSLSESTSSPSTHDTENLDFDRLVRTRDFLASALDVSAEEAAKKWELSMGMSSDFEVAAKMGSGNVRVGTGVFGQRVGKEEAKEIRKGKGFANS